MGAALLRGEGRDQLVAAGAPASDPNQGWTAWRPNLVPWSTADLIGALLTGEPFVRGLRYLAVGAGDPAWDATAPPADPSRTALTAEVARVALVPGKDVTYDRTTGTLSVTVTIPAGVGTATLREVGLFGGLASGRIGSGTLVNHRVHAAIDKAADDRLDREVRLVLDPGLLPGARTMIGGLLAGWKDAAGIGHVAFGDDGAAVPDAEALASERSRAPAERGAVRYVPSAHAVEVSAVLGPGAGPDPVAEVGVLGGRSTSTPGTGLLLARTTFTAVDRSDAATFTHRMRISLVPRIDVVVPDTVGEPIADVAAALLVAGLQLGAITEVEDPTLPPDQVTAQAPVAGATVAEGTPIAVTVAVAPRTAVPMVLGRPLDAAEASIEAAGLTVADPPHERSDDTLVPGTVVDAVPAPGVSVPVATTVDLTVSVKSRVRVPDVRGRPLGLATAALVAKGFAVDDETGSVESDATPGTVAAQEPAPNARTTFGSLVHLDLAVPRTVEVPDLRGLDVDAARAALAEAGAPLLPVGVTDPPGLDVGGRRDQEVARGDPVDVVLTQQPAAGGRLPRYGTVDVTVAVAAAVVVPDLAGTDLTTARARLAGIGLRLGRVQARRSDQPPGVVVTQEPPAGSPARVGDGVTVAVAAGALAVVPDLSGMALEAAREALTAAGLSVGDIGQQAGADRSGDVLGQDPPPGAIVPVGSRVGVTVSAGVPSLVGLPVESARQAAAAVGLTLGEQSVASAGLSGLVLTQDPAAGAQVAGVAQISVTVSVAATVEVPDLGGKPLDAATVALGRRGLSLSIRGRPVDGANAGKVVGQDPAAGVQVPPGSTIAVDIAQQPVPVVTVPDVTTLDRAAAADALTQAGLAVGLVAEQAAIGTPGTVVAQNPAAGELVPGGTPVALTVASATLVVVVVDVRGSSTQDAVSALAAIGLVGEADRRVPSRAVAGTVLDQDPAPGASVPFGSAVSLGVAVAPRPTMPTVVGLTRDRALDVLAQQSLVVSEQTRISRLATGTVIDQVPPAGTPIDIGQQVTIVVAQSILRPHSDFGEEVLVLEPPIRERPFVDDGIVVHDAVTDVFGPGGLGPFRRIERDR